MISRARRTRKELAAAKKLENAVGNLYAHQEYLATPEEITANWDAINILNAAVLVVMGYLDSTIMETVHLWETEND